MPTVIEETYHLGGLDPDAPESNVATRLVDNEDGTGTRYEFDPDGNQTAASDADLPAVAPLELSPTQRMAQLLVAPRVAAEEVDVAAVADLFPPWVPYVPVAVGEVYQFDGGLVEVLQAHDTAPHWTPDVVPALFKIHRPAGAVTAWSQPAGAHDAYSAGELVTHNGSTWESLVDSNVWEPGAPGTASLWQEIG